jgi:prepilin-type N-terminal cleavage/methylation domain-containing protein
VCRSSIPKRDGFTILEVMIAVFVLGITVGGLLQSVQDHVARLADARRDLAAAGEAESRLREVQSAARDGILPDLGRTDGVVDEPHDYLHWELIVEEDSLPRPEGDDLAPPSSSLFAEPGPSIPGGRRRDPDVPEASLLRVSVRVYPEGTEDPERVPPYVAYVVRPADLSSLEALSERAELAPQPESPTLQQGRP